MITILLVGKNTTQIWRLLKDLCEDSSTRKYAAMGTEVVNHQDTQFSWFSYHRRLFIITVPCFISTRGICRKHLHGNILSLIVRKKYAASVSPILFSEVFDRYWCANNIPAITSSIIMVSPNFVLWSAIQKHK